MGTDGLRDASPSGRCADDSKYLRRMQMPLPAAEKDRDIVLSISTQGEECVPRSSRNENRTRLAALPQHGELTTAVASLQILPTQRAEFRNTKAADV
jgi:hypothetical protein